MLKRAFSAVLNKLSPVTKVGSFNIIFFPVGEAEIQTGIISGAYRNYLAILHS